MTIAETLDSGASRLVSHSDSPRLDAELLLCQILRISRAALRTQNAAAVSATDGERFADLVSRRVAGTPVAYLLGSREFWSLPLTVSDAVLVPRPETELLVEKALGCGHARSPLRVLDLGTGSGAIALAIAKERPQWQVTATDVSQAALAVAADNARQLQLQRVALRQGDWYQAVAGARFELIVSNPPYIAADDPALLTLRAEPRQALTPGVSGMESLRQIIAGAPAHLTGGGMLLLEHGAAQGEAVRELLENAGLADIRTHLDLSGLPRVTQGSLHPQH